MSKIYNHPEFYNKEYTFPGEVWKPIEGYEGIHEVSNMGRVKSVEGTYKRRLKSGRVEHRTRKGRVLRTQEAHNGYLRISLRKGSQKGFPVHVLVGRAFISNPENKPQINHKNCDKKDNRASELEWCTPKENMQHAKKMGRLENCVPPPHYSGSKNPKSRAVIQLTMSGEFVKEYTTITQAAVAVNDSTTNISRCCLGTPNKLGKHRRSVKGFKWKYK